MELVRAAIAALLRHLMGGLAVIGGRGTSGNLFMTRPEPDPKRPHPNGHRPGAALTRDEERAWTDLIAELRTTSDEG